MVLVRRDRGAHSGFRYYSQFSALSENKRDRHEFIAEKCRLNKLSITVAHRFPAGIKYRTLRKRCATFFTCVQTVQMSRPYRFNFSTPTVSPVKVQ